MVERIYRSEFARRLNPIVVSPPRKHLWKMAGMKRVIHLTAGESRRGTWFVTTKLPEGLSRSTVVPDPHEGGTVTQPDIARLKNTDRRLLKVTRGDLQKYQRATQGMNPEHKFWCLISEAVDAYENPPSGLSLSEGTRLNFSGPPLLMGVLNVTPDSFSDGGKFQDPSRAVERALEMEENGADIIDVGGESTRPGAEPVSADDELSRVRPVIQNIREKSSIPISIDSRKPPVVKEALQAGANLVNDVGGLVRKPEIAGIAAEHNCPVIAMHMQGEPENMQKNPEYEENPLTDIIGFLRESVAVAIENGLSPDRVIVDPGIGFGKTQEHNFQILSQLHELRSLGLNILLGTSRKSFIGNILDLPVEERVEGTAASISLPAMAGVDIFRVHDVQQMKRFLKVLWTVYCDDTETKNSTPSDS